LTWRMGFPAMMTIIKYSIRENLNKKVLTLSLVLAVIYLGLYGTGLHFAARDILRNSMDPIFANIIFAQFLTLGLYFGSFIISLLAILSSVGTISSEIENGVIQAVIVKPISRRNIILGKFLGTGLFLFTYSILFFLVLYLLVSWQTGLEMTGFLPAMFLFALQPVVLLSVAVLGSVILSTLANGVITFTLYSVGMVGGMLEQMGWMLNNTFLQKTGIVTGLIMPVDTLYRKMVHLLVTPSGGALRPFQEMGPFGSFSEPSTIMMVYAAAYVIVLLFGAVSAFDRRDIT